MKNIQYLKTFYPPATILNKIPLLKFQDQERIYLRNRSELKEKIIGMKNRQKTEKLDIVSDYDQTITSFYDEQQRRVNASFGIFRQSKYVSQELSNKANDLFYKYHEYEISKEYTFEFKQKKMDEWLYESMKLIIDNNINSEMLQNIINDNIFAFRYGFDSFLHYSYSRHLNFFIISGGIQDIIYYTLNQILPLHSYPNLQILANKIYYDETGKPISQSDNKYVHSHNKELVLNRDDYPQLHSSCILLGDMPHDSFMTQCASYQNQIKIGFVRNQNEIDSYKRRYDILIHDQGSFVAVEYLLRKILNPQDNYCIPELLDNQMKIIGQELIDVIKLTENEQNNIQIAFSS